ncbi:hypothetical protein F5141DRAFT_1067849 [Pisolithus sp. B1]|nr:hypothetical protein F5141DRAFT_1067849 [Pisolithus sp. B1]
MSHAYFPESVPEDATLNALMNKRRTIEGSEATRCIMKVHVLANKTQEINLPGSYCNHMRHFVWRENAIWLVLSRSDDLKVEEGLSEMLKKVLWYMGGIFERICVESRKATAREPEWHSETFDSYLQIEYYVLRHEPWLIREFRHNHDMNINRCKVKDLDWIQYEMKLGPLWLGSRMRFTIGARSENDMQLLRSLHESMKAFYNPLVEEDTDFGYTFKEHLPDSNEGDSLIEDVSVSMTDHIQTVDKLYIDESAQSPPFPNLDKQRNNHHCLIIQQTNRIHPIYETILSQSMTITMSDYYWPIYLPTALHLDYITQIRYSVHIDDNPDALKIEMINLHHNRPVPEHRTFIPGYYDKYVHYLIWQYYLYIGLVKHFDRRRNQKKYKKFWPTLLKYIVFLDNVVEALIRPCLGISNNEIGDFHCKNFEEYVITELLLGHHDPKSILVFRSRCPINIERMSLTDFDWDEYSQRLLQEIAGPKYSYDVDEVPEEDWEGLWDAVEGWHKQKLDIKWITSCVPWEDNSGNIVGKVMVF